MTTLTRKIKHDIREKLAARALHIIDSAFLNAMSVMDEIESPEVFFREDHRVLDAILFLASIGFDGDSLPDLEISYRFNAVQWDSLLIHALGATLLNVAKGARAS